MDINRIIIYIIVFFMILGAADRILGNRFGLGAKFEEGFHAMGPCALSMIGINCMAPLLGKWIQLLLGPFFHMFGADPVMAGSIILSIDTGGYALAHSVTGNADIANYSSVILGSMMGPTLAFGIPVALGIIHKKDIRYLALGTLSGLIVIPFACVIGGLIAGYRISMVLVNMVPVFLIAALIALGLGFFPDGMVKGFAVFAKLMMTIITLSLVHAIVSALTGITLIRGTEPISASFNTIGSIAIMLAGAYPMVYVITKLAAKPLAKLGKLMGIDEIAAAGLITTLANSIPTYSMIKNMDDKGKTVNFAFTCCAAFALGDHLGFCAGIEPELVFPMAACKILGGLLSIPVALLAYKLQENRLVSDINKKRLIPTKKGF